MRIELDYNKDELKRASGNYDETFNCYLVEIIRNKNNDDTYYRIEFMDNNFINISIEELKTLKVLLNNDIVTKLLQLDTEVK